MSIDELRLTEVRYVAEDASEVHAPLCDVDIARLQRALPVRRIRSYAHQRHYPGLFWSATTRRHIPYESRLELGRLWLADFAPEVTWIASQPMWLVGRDGGVTRRHVPDLILSRRGAPPLVVDVKPAAFAELPRSRAVFDWTSRVCRARGWGYEVWTGADPVELANVRTIGGARRHQGAQLEDSCRRLRGVAREE